MKKILCYALAIILVFIGLVSMQISINYQEVIGMPAAIWCDFLASLTYISSIILIVVPAMCFWVEKFEKYILKNSSKDNE